MTKAAFRVGLVGALAAAGAACAVNPPAVVSSAPRYPSFPMPVVPAGLEAPGDLRDRHALAWQRLQSGDLRAAAREFGRILDEMPSFYPAAAGRGFAELADRDYRSAIASFERAVAADDNYLPAWQGLANARIEYGREVEAIPALERVAALDPSREAEIRGRIELLRFREVQALISASREARGRGRLDEAIEALRRALVLSPQSAVILRDLAAVERERGDLDEALVHARRAVELDVADAEAHATLGTVLEARQDLEEAASAFAQAAAIDGRPEWRARSASLASRARLAALPPEMGTIASAAEVTRAQAAALIGLRLDALVSAAPRRVTAVATDVRGHWAAGWILPVTQAGIMEIFPNHTFQPAGTMRRGDLARIVGELLPLAAGNRQADLARWQAATPRFADVSPTHLVYRAAAAAVAAGAMTAEDGRFEPTRPATGAELTAAIDRIEQLARR